MDERITKILNHKATVPVALGIIVFSAGFGIGYLKKRKKTEEWVEPTLPDLEVDIPFDTTIVDRQMDRTSAAVAEHLQRQKMKEEDTTIVVQPAAELEEDDEPDPVPRNVFAQNGDKMWNYEEEVKKRTETEPYILHQDEFFAMEKGYTQMTLTYYVGDDIMADQEDVLVYGYLEKTGPLSFGSGSGSPDVFYVRNDKYRAEYEILRHEGHYAVEVQGLEMEQAVDQELKHSSPEKFRD